MFISGRLCPLRPFVVGHTDGVIPYCYKTKANCRKPSHTHTLSRGRFQVIYIRVDTHIACFDLVPFFRYA